MRFDHSARKTGSIVMAANPIHLITHKSFDAAAPVLGRIGNMETRLARTKREVRQAQKIRYQVFLRGIGRHRQSSHKIAKAR